MNDGHIYFLPGKELKPPKVIGYTQLVTDDVIWDMIKSNMYKISKLQKLQTQKSQRSMRRLIIPNIHMQ